VGRKEFVVFSKAPFVHPASSRAVQGSIVLDQIRTIDRDRLLRRFGKVSSSTIGRVLTILEEMFEP